MYEIYLELLEEGYFEIGEAFKGLADENVWKRPAEGLLSAGELAGHIAYGEAVRFLRGESDDPTRFVISSPLVDARFRYYPTTLATPPSEEQLALTAEQVWTELRRVHNAAVEAFKELNPDLDTFIPGDPSKFTYREFLRYSVFHLAYHTGQIYSARHILGEETPDN